MKAIYEPPYDSPIEDRFAHHYVKYASDEVEMKPQVEVKTLCGRFILDFVLSTSDGIRIGIECDGREFHDESRDEWRDAMILGEGHVDVMYRLRGSDITYFIEDILYLMVVLDPFLFSFRAMENLKVLASTEIQEIDKGHCKDIYHFKYRNEVDIGSFRIETRRRAVPVEQCRFWQAAYNFAVSIGGGGLDDVMEKYRFKSINS
jgi:hypothetical protein